MSQDFSEFVEIGILQQRKIEAEIVKPIYEIMKREFGLEKAKTIIEEAVANAALEAGKEYAKREPNGTSVLRCLITHMKNIAITYIVADMRKCTKKWD